MRTCNNPLKTLFPWLCLVKASVAPVDYYFIMLGQTSINIHQNVSICVLLWMEEKQKIQRGWKHSHGEYRRPGCAEDIGVLFDVSWKYCVSFSFSFFFFFEFITLRGGRAETAGEGESQAGPTLSARSPTRGLIPQTEITWPELKPSVPHSTGWATQAPQKYRTYGAWGN